MRHDVVAACEIADTIETETYYGHNLRVVLTEATPAERETIRAVIERARDERLALEGKTYLGSYPKGGTMTKEEREVVEGIRENILKNLAFSVHVFQTIWEAQQEVEKFTGQYHGSDGKGFQRWETEAMNRLHDEAEERGWMFTPVQAEWFQKTVSKYAAQYRRLTKPRIEAERAKAEA